MSKLDDFIAHSMAAQARIEQKLDDSISLRGMQHEEQRAICEKHYTWTAAIQKKVDEHEALKNRAMGALKIASVAGPVMAAGGIIAKIKHWFGF
jgi:hypothetical protein